MNLQLVKKASSAIILVSLLSFTQDTAPGKITFESERLYPEGITFDDKRELIYLSSLTQGKISSVDKQGNYKVVCEDPRLIATVGLKYNNRTGKLYVTNDDMGMSPRSTDATKFSMAQLAIIDVASSKLETIVDLSGLTSGKHMLNDLTIDNEDNVYITDSYAHVVYKVDKSNKASILSQSPLFKPDSITLGLNGIAYHKGGFLLLAKSVQGSLLKVSLKDPSVVEQVKLPEPLFWGDGIYFTSDKDLVVVRNRFSKTVFLHSDDNWASATIVKEEKATDLMPTTATAYNGNVYVINSRLSEIKDNKPTKQFVIDVYKAK
jgi:DNA-binding beta-propeller fold protein YncE